MSDTASNISTGGAGHIQCRAEPKRVKVGVEAGVEARVVMGEFQPITPSHAAWFECRTTRASCQRLLRPYTDVTSTFHFITSKLSHERTGTLSCDWKKEQSLGRETARQQYAQGIICFSCIHSCTPTIPC